MFWYSKALYLTIIISNLFIPVTTDKYCHFFSFKKKDFAISELINKFTKLYSVFKFCSNSF